MGVSLGKLRARREALTQVRLSLGRRRFCLHRQRQRNRWSFEHLFGLALTTLRGLVCVCVYV